MGDNNNDSSNKRQRERDRERKLIIVFSHNFPSFLVIDKTSKTKKTREMSYLP